MASPAAPAFRRGQTRGSAERPSRSGGAVRRRSVSGSAPSHPAGALLSTMDYATAPASTGYGKGIELRLEEGELEFRWADRYPAYSARVRSQGARVVRRQMDTSHARLCGTRRPRRAARQGFVDPHVRRRPRTARHESFTTACRCRTRTASRRRRASASVGTRCAGGSPYKGAARRHRLLDARPRHPPRSKRYSRAAPSRTLSADRRGDPRWLRDAALRRSDPRCRRAGRCRAPTATPSSAARRPSW